MCLGCGRWISLRDTQGNAKDCYVQFSTFPIVRPVRLTIVPQKGTSRNCVTLQIQAVSLSMNPYKHCTRISTFNQIDLGLDNNATSQPSVFA